MNNEIYNSIILRMNNIVDSLNYLHGKTRDILMMIYFLRDGFEGSIIDLDKKVKDSKEKTKRCILKNV